MSSYHHLHVHMHHYVLHPVGIRYFLPYFGICARINPQQRVCETFVITSAIQLLLRETRQLKDAMTNLNQC